MAVRVVYHVHAPAGGAWEPIVGEQVHGVLLSGLYDAAEAVHCFVSGPDAAAAAAALRASGAKFAVERCEPADRSAERLALLGARTLVQPGDAVLYLHSKGVTKPGSAAVRDWRRMMERFLVGRHAECRRLLRTHDVVGCNWAAEPAPHFSGNFWWCRGDHFLALPEAIGPAHTDPEFHVGRRPGVRVACVHSSGGVDHYGQRYPPAAYV